MSTRIFKYRLETTAFQSVLMPVGAEIIAMQAQGDTPCVWAIVEVDSDAPLEPRHFRIYGTGHEMDRQNLAFLGTYQLRQGSLVFHVFEYKGKPGKRGRGGFNAA